MSDTPINRHRLLNPDFFKFLNDMKFLKLYSVVLFEATFDPQQRVLRGISSFFPGYDFQLKVVLKRTTLNVLVFKANGFNLTLTFSPMVFVLTI